MKGLLVLVVGIAVTLVVASLVTPFLLDAFQQAADAMK